MRSFIFITKEGITYQPDSCAEQPDVENCQVVGFGKGVEVTEAIENFLMVNPWIMDTTFNQVMVYELKVDEILYPKLDLLICRTSRSE